MSEDNKAYRLFIYENEQLIQRIRLGFERQYSLLLLGQYLHSFQRDYDVIEIDDYKWRLTDKVTGAVREAHFGQEVLRITE